MSSMDYRGIFEIEAKNGEPSFTSSFASINTTSGCQLLVSLTS